MFSRLYGSLINIKCNSWSVTSDICFMILEYLYDGGWLCLLRRAKHADAWESGLHISETFGRNIFYHRRLKFQHKINSVRGHKHEMFKWRNIEEMAYEHSHFRHLKCCWINFKRLWLHTQILVGYGFQNDLKDWTYKSRFHVAGLWIKI